MQCIRNLEFKYNCNAFGKLHLDLNLKTFHIRIGVKILCCCTEGGKEDPKTLKWIFSGQMKMKEETMTNKMNQHIKALTGFSQAAKALATNPGKVARQVLHKDNRQEMFSILPDCITTKKFFTLLEKLDAIREIYRAKLPSKIQRDSLPEKCQDYIDFLTSQFPWTRPSNIVHLMSHHLPQHFHHPKNIGSISALSSSGLELGNKQLRYGISHRSFRGDLKQLLRDTMRYSFLQGTMRFKKITNDGQTLGLQFNMKSSDDNEGNPVAVEEEGGIDDASGDQTGSVSEEQDGVSSGDQDNESTDEEVDIDGTRVREAYEGQLEKHIYGYFENDENSDDSLDDYIFDTTSLLP